MSVRLQAAENEAREDMYQRRRNDWGISVAEAYAPNVCLGRRPPWIDSDSDREDSGDGEEMDEEDLDGVGWEEDFEY